jgi:hypothetical protein
MLSSGLEVQDLGCLMPNERLHGNVRISVRNLAGQIIQTIETHNIVFNETLTEFRDWFANQSLTNNSLIAPDYIAIGTGTSTFTGTETAIETEVFRKQVSRRYPSGPYSLQFYLALDTTEANGNVLTECGLCNWLVGGRTWNRALHTAITKTSSISVTYEITVTFGAA